MIVIITNSLLIYLKYLIIIVLKKKSHGSKVSCMSLLL